MSNAQDLIEIQSFCTKTNYNNILDFILQAQWKKRTPTTDSLMETF